MRLDSRPLVHLALIAVTAGVLLHANLAWGEELRNPIGIMLGGGGLDVQQRIAAARELGVTMVRPWDISLEEWTGRHSDAETFIKAGFKIILTIRNNGQGGPPPRPTSPPNDLDAYMQKLGEVLDVHRPELLVVENEENSGLYYLGTPKQYGAELKAACAVAHRKGIKCTNGGMVSSLVATLVWSHYRDRREAAKAEDFLRRTTSQSQQKMLRTIDGQHRIGEAIAKGKALLTEYRTAGIDYVNFHWYLPDPTALGEAVEFLKAETGLQPISNEMGQHDADPGTVGSLLAKALELRLPYVIWFSLDRPDAKALQETDGTLRVNGLAFKSLVRGMTEGMSGPRPPPPQ